MTVRVNALAGRARSLHTRNRCMGTVPVGPIRDPIQPSRRPSNRCTLQRRQLTAWEHAGLIPANEQYSFEDLAQLRTLRALRARASSAKSIRESVEGHSAGLRHGQPVHRASAVGHGAHLSFPATTARWSIPSRASSPSTSRPEQTLAQHRRLFYSRDRPRA